MRGAAGGTEARAGWGRGSERVRAPRTWSLGNVTPFGEIEILKGVKVKEFASLMLDGSGKVLL